jgi:hypothetical protein
VKDLVARRWGAQGLGAGSRRGAAEVVRRLLAVQAQDERAARLAIRARSRGIASDDVDAALAARELVGAWLMRGTLHLVASEDLDWLLALTAPGRMAANRRRLGQEGVPPGDADRAVAEIERALGADGPLTRAQLAERVAGVGVRSEGQAMPHLLMLAVLRGVAVGTGDQAFAHRHDWLGKRRDVDGDAALAELARRYLAGHGPAADADLAAWSGLPLGAARRGLEAIAGELTERADGLVDLARRRRAAEPAPRLLGAFDPYLLGWRDRSFAVASGGERRVHPGGGMLRAVATVRGRAVASWTARRARGRMTIAIEPFAKIAAADREALGREAADVARFEGLELAAVE